ncbi:NAD(P)H-binding protein [Nonomuraea sp. NPDC049158]|uniref:NAD(P)H-binding protein n=1 Tax=Nonomuraea sp. NPDC049158 TaxID=3155649 RepID=UPI0033D480CD
MIVVTGATGTLGAPLVRGLRERGVPTRAISRTTASPEPGIQWVTADLDDMSTLVAAYADADAVFLVTPVHPRMARFARNVIEAAVRGGNRPRIVLLAAAGLDQNVRGVRFLNAHAEGLAALRASDLPYTVLAPNGFFQNLLTMAGAIRAGTLAAPAGDAAISFVDARDVADVAAHVLTTDGHDRATYTLTGPQSLTHAEIAGQLGAVAGSTVRYSALSPEQARDQLTAAGLDPWRVDGLIELYGFYASGHAAAVSDDIERLLGRAPRSLAEFAADHRQAFTPWVKQ